MPKQEHFGLLRPQVSTIDDNARIQVEWVGPTGEIVWTETMENRAGQAAVSQIQCEGTFSVQSGMYVDSEGKRHYVLKADPGRVGAPFG